MSALVALNPSNKTQSFNLFTEITIPTFIHLDSANKFDAMAEVECDFYDADLTLKNRNRGNDLHINPADLLIKVKSVMDAETSEELVSFDDNGNLFDPSFEEDLEKGHLVPIEDNAEQVNQPFKVNLSQSITDDLKAEQDKLYEAANNSTENFNEGKLLGFIQALGLIGVTIPFPEKDGNEK